MRAGTDSALARVIAVFGAAHPHHAYLFANRRGNRIKMLVHDGLGIWLAAHRLHQGKIFRFCATPHNHKNWLFASSLRACQRAAAIMSLIQSAKLNGYNLHLYLSDVMERLPTWPNK